MDDQQRLLALRTELGDIIRRMAPEEGDFPISHGVKVFRRDGPTTFHHGESAISYCVIAQGTKHVEVGDRKYVFTPEDIFITTVKLPTISYVVDASPEQPYLSMTLDMNPGLVKSVYLAAEPEALGKQVDVAACSLTPIHLTLLDATVRLMRAIEVPAEAEFLAPMIQQEIIFRLLTTDHEGRIRQIAGMSTVSNRIKSALDQLREEFNQPLRISEIAGSAGMSISTFHEHFKKVTGLTPLQYQKELRLREARRLLLHEDIDVAGAGYTVGYGDASHFNRDYKRMFGLPPMRDIEAMRNENTEDKAS